MCHTRLADTAIKEWHILLIERAFSLMVSIKKHINNSTPWEIGSKSLFKVQPNRKQKDILPIYYKPTGMYHLTTWILRYSTLKRYDKLVALEIAAYYNVEKGYCYPNYEHLSSELGISERTVGNAVQQMKLSGEWLAVPHAIDPRIRAISNRYYPLTPISQESYLSNNRMFQQAGYFNGQGKAIPPLVHNSIEDYKVFMKKVIVNGE